MIRLLVRPGLAALLAIFLASGPLSAVVPLSLPSGGSCGDAVADDDDHRVYLLLAEGMPGSIDEVVQRLVEEVDASPWEVVAGYDVGTDFDDCPYRAHVLILHSAAYANSVLEAGLRGAFAIPVRLAVFEDERGVNIGAVNPMSLNRTMVAEEGGEDAWLEVAGELRNLTAGAFPEFASSADYGQKRDKGRIGRTMGIMAGGPFDGKITEVVRVPSAEMGGTSGVAALLSDGVGEVPGEWEWQLAPVFVIDMPESGVAVLGVGGGPVESRSFDIVGKGGDDSRDDYVCPGLNHAPAYPIEVVVSNEGEEVAIYVVNEMFRMKMYFENAGRMAFARNMGMPGSIEDELKDKIRAVLNPSE